jgi:hypothetical protein
MNARLSLLVLLASSVLAGSATDVTGLYFTGVDNLGTGLSAGSVDPHWTVTYAYASGNSSNSNYMGSAYVSTATDSAWVPNSSTAKWIVPPGGASGNGDYNLPGNGTTGNNRAYFIYSLAFNIPGTGSGVVTNDVSIGITIAADDIYSIYVNPSLRNSGDIASSVTPAVTNSSAAWSNTSSATLANFGASNNSVFNIGTNYLRILVRNTNSVTGSSNSNTVNPTGLLFYQTNNAVTIDGRVIPEVGTTLPILGAAFLYLSMRRRRYHGNI